jgi:hypothetical protein
MIRGRELHSIIRGVFGEVKNYLESEQIQVNCPVCQERDGLMHPDDKFNLEINTAKKMFRCWKCDNPSFTGSLGRLIKTYGSQSDYEIYKSYATTFSSFDTADEYEEHEYKVVSLPKEMILFANMNPSNPQHFEAYNYMVLDRKIDKATLIKYKIGFCVDGRYAKRVIIPSYDRYGNVNYFVGRSFDPLEKKKKYLNPNIDKNKIIFNEGYVNWDSTVYLVEGAFEFLTFPVNTIPLLGKTIFEYLLLKLKEHKPNVIIVLDPDAYRKSIELYFEISAVYVGHENKIRLVKLPNDDDLDEVRKKYGESEVIKHLYSARYLTVDDYFISKLVDDSKKYRRYTTYNKSY